MYFDLSFTKEVIAKYRDRIRKLEPEIKQVLKQEEEEKQIRVSEMEMNKARNMIEHEAEIFSRPAKTWIQSSADRKRKNDVDGNSDGMDGALSKRAKREAIKAKKMKKPETVHILIHVSE